MKNKLLTFLAISAAGLCASQAADFYYLQHSGGRDTTKYGNTSLISENWFDSNVIENANYYTTARPSSEDDVYFTDYYLTIDGEKYSTGIWSDDPARQQLTATSGVYAYTQMSSVHTGGAGDLSYNSINVNFASDYLFRDNKTYENYSMFVANNSTKTEGVKLQANTVNVNGGTYFRVYGSNIDTTKPAYNYWREVNFGQVILLKDADETVNGLKVDNYVQKINVGVTDSGSTVVANGKVSSIGAGSIMTLGSNTQIENAQTINLGSLNNNGTLNLTGTGTVANQYGTLNLNLDSTAKIDALAFNINGTVNIYNLNQQFTSTKTTINGTVNALHAAGEGNIASRFNNVEINGNLNINKNTVYLSSAVNNGTINIINGGYLHLMSSTSFVGGDNGVINLGAGYNTVYVNSNCSLGNVSSLAVNGGGMIRTSSSGNASLTVGTNNVSQVFIANITVNNGGNGGVLSLTKVGESWQVFQNNSNFTGATVVNGGALFITKAKDTSGKVATTASAVTVNNGAYFGSAGSQCNIASLTLNSGGKVMFNMEFSGNDITMASADNILTTILATDFAFANVADSMLDNEYTLFNFEDMKISAALQAIIDSEDNGKYEFVDAVNGSKYYATFSTTEAAGDFNVTLSVPEPSTYAAIFGLMALAFAIYRRRQSK